MSRGAISSEGSGGEGIHHFSTVRIRATGQGTLLLTINSLDSVKNSKTLVPLEIQPISRIQPNRIVNFVEQRASLVISTRTRDDYFRLNRIVFYTKEIYTSHPGA